MNLKDKKVLVTGGSGSLGIHLIPELEKRGATDIISLSRDEGLIRDAEQVIASPHVEFLVGDVSDSKTMETALDGVDIVYHAAAIKHVSIAERNPREVLRINVMGTLNVLDHSRDLERFVNISTDKVIGVTNCYGASKLLAEYLVQETNRIFQGNFVNIRCPNFLASRGSVIDIWQKSIKKHNMIQVTDPDMTRYFICLPDAARFVVETSLRNDLSPSETYYPARDTRKFRLGELAQAFVNVFGDEKTEIRITGKLPGEKVHENYIEDFELTGVHELEKILRTVLMSSSEESLDSAVDNHRKARTVHGPPISTNSSRSTNSSTLSVRSRGKASRRYTTR